MVTVRRQTSPMLIKLKAAIGELGAGLNTKVGWLENNTYPDSTMTVAEAAMISEFGAPSRKIPERPFFRPTISEKSTDWTVAMTAFGKRIAKGTMTPFQAMDALGLIAAGDVKQTIATLTQPALSPLTIAIRVAESKGIRVMGGADVGAVAGLMAQGQIEMPETGSTITKPLIHTGLMLATLTHLTTTGSAE